MLTDLYGKPGVLFIEYLNRRGGRSQYVESNLRRPTNRQVNSSVSSLEMQLEDGSLSRAVSVLQLMRDVGEWRNTV